MSNFVIGIRDEETRNFVIEADEDAALNQIVGKDEALKALKKATPKHGIRQVELFQLVTYDI